MLTAATCFPNGINYGDLSILNVKVNSEKKDFELIGEDEDILKHGIKIISYEYDVPIENSFKKKLAFSRFVPSIN